jgi:hypothetical protein
MKKEVFEVVDSTSRNIEKAAKKRREKKQRQFNRKLEREF